ncbi:MAG: T9SS type A sorting domain-containing protein, partial [Cytophagales bacterium]|nr:T9SS type A sorting domain-containing protein [Cytophagales bacterium]
SSDHPQRAWRPKLKVCKRNATSIPTYSSDASTTFVEEIQLFPNPATSEHVEVVSSIPFSSVKVYAIDGTLMFTSNEKLININIQNYLSGIYTAVFNTDAGTRIKKFIKY